MGVCCRCTGKPGCDKNNKIEVHLLKNISHERNEDNCRNSSYIEGDFVSYKPVTEDDKVKCRNALNQTQIHPPNNGDNGCPQYFPEV